MLKTHGVRGELWALWNVLEPQVGAPYFLSRPPKEPLGPFSLKEARPHKKGWLLKFEGLESLTEAEQFLKHDLLSESVILAEGQFWVRDLVGMDVVTEEGERLGTLKDVLDSPAQDLFMVWTGKKEILLPALKSVIRNVDHANRRITVHLLPGLEETF